jgi:hypothetical protein
MFVDTALLAGFLQDASAATGRPILNLTLIARPVCAPKHIATSVTPTNCPFSRPYLRWFLPLFFEFLPLLPLLPLLPCLSW